MAIDLSAGTSPGGAADFPTPKAAIEASGAVSTSPLLTCTAAPFPFPLQASAADGPPARVTLTVTASNLTPSPVTLQAMAITLPVGTGAAELTTDAGSIQPIPPQGWTLGPVQNPPGGVQYVFLAPTGGAALPADQSLSFVFGTVEVNAVPGPLTLTVMEGSGGCSLPACPSTNLQLTKFPSGWGQVTFSASDDHVTLGTPVTLGWQGPAGATYVLDFYLPQAGVVVVPAAGAPALGNQGVYPGTAGPPLVMEQTTTFNLTVTDNVAETEYTAKSQYTVNVLVPPPAVTFSTVPVWVDMTQPPANVQVAWTTTSASELSIDGVGSFTGAAAAQGTAPVYPTATATWFATAYGLPGFSGPPAAAQATVRFGGSSSTGPYPLVDNSQNPWPWTLVIEGQSILTLGIVPASEQNSLSALWATPAPGVMMASLGTVQGGASVAAVMNAQYGASYPPLSLWSGGAYDMREGFRDQGFDLSADPATRLYTDEPENLTATWGVQLADGRAAALWYGVADVLVSDVVVHRNFTFSWICYGPLSR